MRNRKIEHPVRSPVDHARPTSFLRNLDADRADFELLAKGDNPAKAAVVILIDQLVCRGWAQRLVHGLAEVEVRLVTGETLLLGEKALTRIA
jgi:hypothetical protein